MIYFQFTCFVNGREKKWFLFMAQIVGLLIQGRACVPYITMADAQHSAVRTESILVLKSG